MTIQTIDALLTAITGIPAFTVKAGALYVRDGNHHGQLFMTLPDLAALDARLPAIIEGLPSVSVSYLGKRYADGILSNFLNDTIRSWEPPATLKTLTGEDVPYHGLRWIRMTKSRAKSPVVRVATRFSKLRPYTSEAGETVDIAYSAINAEHTVNVSWLNEQYPGWKERYMAGEFLGHTPETLCDYVLSAQTEQLNLDTGSITFD